MGSSSLRAIARSTCSWVEKTKDIWVWNWTSAKHAKCWHTLSVRVSPLICGCSSVCCACSHAGRSVPSARQTWSQKNSTTVTSKYNQVVYTDSTQLTILPFVTLCIQAVLLQSQLCLLSTCNTSSQFSDYNYNSLESVTFDCPLAQIDQNIFWNVEDLQT